MKTKNYFLLLLLICSNSYAGKWVMLKGYDISKIFYNDMAEKSGVKRSVEIVGSDGLSWPDGRQAIILHILVKQDKKQWLYRCNQYFDSSMQSTGEACYELRK